MLENPFTWLAVIVLITVLTAKGVRIASENQRFAVHNLGKFIKFRGPGVLFKFTSNESKWTRITAGDRGKAITSNMCRVNNADVPISSDDKVRIGDYVRIAGFTDSVALVALDQDQRRSYICEKCGHENTLK